MLGVAAGITVLLVFHVSHWVTAVLLMATAVVAVVEGSYLEWKDADTRRRKAESDLKQAESDLKQAESGLKQLKLDKVRQTVDSIVSKWRAGTLRSIDFATDPDISYVVARSRYYRRFMGDSQPGLLGFNPGVKTQAYALVDDCVQAFGAFESVMNLIDFTWKEKNKDLEAMYKADPSWKDRANNALRELQRRVNTAIEAIDKLHGDALINPVASSNGGDYGPLQ